MLATSALRLQCQEQFWVLSPHYGKHRWVALEQSNNNRPFCVCVCVFVGPCHPVYFVPPVESSLPCTHPQYSPFRPCLPFPRSQCPLFVDSHCYAYSMLPRVHSIGRVRLTFVVKCHLFMCSFPCFPRPICYPVFSSMLPMCLPFLPAPSTLSPFCFHRSSCECGLRFWQQRE